MPLDVAALRAGSRARAAARPDGPELYAVTDTVVPSTPFVRARHYRPVAEPRPLLVFLHGGMWVLGDLESHDALCRRIAHGAGVEVVAVDYRRAPEHPWPAAVDDAVAAVRWAAGGLGGARAPGPSPSAATARAAASPRSRRWRCAMTPRSSSLRRS